jgi:hypothetical protein
VLLFAQATILSFADVIAQATDPTAPVTPHKTTTATVRRSTLDPFSTIPSLRAVRQGI